MAAKVLITFTPVVRTPGPHMDMLREAGCEVVAPMNERPLTAAEVMPLIADADAIVAGVDDLNATVLAAAPRLKVVSRFGVGFDSVDLAAATREGIVVTTTPGCNHVSVAELAVGLIFSLARRIPQMNAATHAGEWPMFRGIELAGKTLGVVGIGRIGRAIASRARGLEMEVIAYDVVPDEAFAAAQGIPLVPLAELLRRSDFVTLHCPATPGAPPLIGEAELALMKPGAYLINTARGTLVDEEALYRALVDGKLAGAGLDVFHHEPPGNHPLLTLDSVVATPHIGGTQDSGVRSSRMAVENLLAVLHGERCANAVNPKVYEQPNLRSKA